MTLRVQQPTLLTDDQSGLMGYKNTSNGKDVIVNSIPLSSASIATIGAGILTAAAIVGGSVTRAGVQTANFTDVTDTAALIIAAMPVPVIGQSIRSRIMNTTAYQQTVTGGTGVTLSGKPFVIAPNTLADVVVAYTAANAVTISVEMIADLGVDNFNATTDPGATNDNTQGYGVGSCWFNTTTSREWTCLSAATGAAVWFLSGVVPGVGMEPSNMLTQFGNSAFGQPFNAFSEEGNLYRNIGNPIAQNAADLTDDILGGIVIPANAFDVSGRGICMSFQGKLAATANNKRIKIWANPAMAGQAVTAGVISGGTVTGAGAGVLLYDSAVQTGNGIGWSIMLNLFKYGAALSNTQYSQATPIFGTTHGGIGLPIFSALPENAPINIVVTGSSPTTGAAGDVVLNFVELNAMN